MALQRRAQGAGDACGPPAAGCIGGGAPLLSQGPLAQQVAGKVRRDSLAGIEGAALQRRRDKQVQRVAVHTGDRLAGALVHVAQHPAGALRHLGRPGIGRTHQGSGHGRLALVEPVRGLAKQRAGQCIDAHQLTPERHEIEVGLQDLVLAPAPVQHLGGHRLAQLLHHRAPARALAPVAIEQAGQLHGEGAGPARAQVPQVAPGSGRCGAPVHPAVLIKAFVLAEHQGLAQGGRHVGQHHPLAAPHGGVGAQALHHLALAREDQRVGRAEILAHLRKGGQSPGHWLAQRNAAQQGQPPQESKNGSHAAL